VPDRRTGQHPRPRRGRRQRVASARSRALEPLEVRRFFAQIAVYGDMSAGTGAQGVSNLIHGWNPDYIVSVGDNYYAADAVIDNVVGRYFHDYVWPYAGSYGAGSPNGNRFWSALGNHEYDHSAGAADYLNFFAFPGNERYYKLSQGNVDWFFVNSNAEEPDGNTPNSAQYNWLQQQLAGSTATWQFVVFHHPPYSSANSTDATNMDWPFAQWGADAVFSGHQHLYERLSVDGIPYIISGLGGASISTFGTVDPHSQVRYNANNGAMLLDVGASTVTFKFYNVNGTQIDSYAILLPGAPSAPANFVVTPFSDSRVDLSWTDGASNETAYVVERSSDGVNGWSQIASLGANVTTCSDIDALPGATYFYRVRAMNGAIPGADSVVASATTLAPNTQMWIGPGATWKYNDSGANLGTAWRAAVYDDSAWASGRAQLGYGDGDEGTTVGFGPDANNKYITTYFRRSFSVGDPSRALALDLRMLRDDGAVVYLNGTEVWRSNMPTGTIFNTTLASGNVNGAPENQWFGVTTGGTLLQPGSNTIAVEIHQSVANSSDLSFDFSLVAHLANGLAAPSATRAVAVSPTRVDVSWIDTVDGETGFKIERSTNGVSFAPIGQAAADASGYIDLTAAPSTPYWYRVRAYDAGGDGTAGSVASVTTPAASSPSSGDSVAAAPPKNKGQALKLQRKLLDMLA
jgi:hypothetical protein